MPINPEIEWASPTKRRGEEGCLSVPGIYDGVERSIAVKVRARREGREPRDRGRGPGWRSASSTRSTTLTARSSCSICRSSSATASRPSLVKAEREARR